MKNEMNVRHEFVEFMPDQLKDGVIYVSIPLATVIHKCCCGCGMEVVTPLSPNDWRLIFDGDTISIEPSIGNWDYACRSHYWIKHNRIKWAGQWSQEEIERGKFRERAAREQYYGNSTTLSEEVAERPETLITKKPKGGQQRWSQRKKRKK